MAEALEPHVSIGFTLQSAPHVHRPPFCLERTGEWASAGFPGTVTGPGAVTGPVVSTSHATGSVLRPYTTRQSGPGSGRQYSPEQAAVTAHCSLPTRPDVGPSTRGGAAPERGEGAAGSTTPASCWEFPVYKTQTVILAQLRRSRAAIDVKGFVHCKVLGWRKNPCHSRGCVGRLVCGGGGRGWHGRTS